jgi:CBS domain-containing protein
MKAGDIMTRRIIAIHDDTAVDEAVRLMLQDDISALPVVDRAGKALGIVSEGDLLRRAETGTEMHRPRWLEFLVGPGRLSEEYVRTHARCVSEIMTRDLVSVTEDTDLSEVVRLMERKRVKRVLVMRGERLIGLITRSNLLQALARLASEAKPTPQSDQAIRDGIAAEMAKLKWMPRASVNPIVQDGVVDLHGTIFDDRERDALKVLCENVPGVKQIRDHLIWIEPYSGMPIGPLAGVDIIPGSRPMM